MRLGFRGARGGSGDLIGTDAAAIDAKLGTLGNNGGHTPTLLLLFGSPAIDAGGATCPAGVTTDQRGASRPQGSACDIGAYEYQAPDALPGPKPSVPAGGPPNPVPTARPAGSSGGPTPNPLPGARP